MRNRDARLVNKVASDYVRRVGINAVPDLVEYAEIASSLGSEGLERHLDPVLPPAIFDVSDLRHIAATL